MLPKFRQPTHPGEILLEEFIKPLGITQVDLAKRLGWTYAKLSEIIHEKRGISPDSALDLEKILGSSAFFWLNLQMNYDLWKAKQKKGKTVKGRGKFAQEKIRTYIAAKSVKKLKKPKGRY